MQQDRNRLQRFSAGSFYVTSRIERFVIMSATWDELSTIIFANKHYYVSRLYNLFNRFKNTCPPSNGNATVGFVWVCKHVWPDERGRGSAELCSSAGASGGGEEACPLARHNKRFTIEEIIKIVATRCQILRLKCTKSFVSWGSAPDPARGAYSVPQTPSWILGATSNLKGEGKGQEGKGGMEGKGRTGEGRRGEGREGERGRGGTERGGMGRGRGRVGPLAKAWPPELFSWRQRCSVRCTRCVSLTINRAVWVTAAEERRANLNAIVLSGLLLFWFVHDIIYEI